MRIVFELRRHQPPDRFNFGIRNFRGLPFERDEGNGTIRPERLVVTPRRRNINEEIIFEKRLFDDLVPITPPPPDFVCRQERLDEAARKILENLFFVTRSCVQRIPGHSERSATADSRAPTSTLARVLCTQRGAGSAGCSN